MSLYDLGQFNFDSTFAAKAQFLSSVDLTSSTNVREIYETILHKNAPLTGEAQIDVNNGSLHYYNEQSTGNFTFNIKGLYNIAAGKSIVVTILSTMGSTAYVMSNPTTTGFKIDDNVVTVKWINSISPTSGFTNSINVYTFAIIKNSTNNYTVLGTLSNFG